MSFKSHFRFNKQERSGIFFLLLLLILIQIGLFIYKKYGVSTSRILQVDIETQKKIDVLKKKEFRRDTVEIYPFNPSFISDYKGYALGMSVEEIDRLHEFRASKKFVNSKEEFQKVTQVSDSLLSSISPYFKFPEWVTNKSSTLSKKTVIETGKNLVLKENVKLLDLNLATAKELKSIYGIGEKLSSRIVKFRDRLGGFLINEQLYDVYGLEPEVVQRTLNKFQVLKAPEIQKIDVNEASAYELSELVYIQRNVAENIVDYRNRNGTIKSFDELSKIEGFPINRINRIALYLSIKK